MNSIVIKCMRLGFLGFSLLTMPSCLLYRYHPACVDLPDEWRTANDNMPTTVNLKWWKQLGDPVLDALIVEALAYNNEIQVAVARVLEYQSRVGIVTSQLYPQINGQFTAVRQRVSQTLGPQFGGLEGLNGLLGGNNGNATGSSSSNVTPSISPLLNAFFAMFNISYEVDFWGKIRSATDAAYADLLGQIENRRTVVLTIVSSLANAYIVLRQYDRQLQIALQTLKSRQESYELADVRFKEGLTSELEVKQAASEVDEARIQVIQFNYLIPQQENLISVLIGRYPQEIRRGDNIDEWKLPPEIPTGIPADILQQRPDIVQAEDQLIAASARVGEARALFFPNISLTGYYGSQSSPLHDLFTNPARAWQIAGNLLQPIFEGGRLVSNLDLTKAVKAEAYYNYQQTILNALQEVDDALIAHEQSLKGLEAEHERVKDLSDYLQLARLQYQNGLVDYLNVLDAERRLFGSQLDLAQAQAYVFRTLVSIYQSLGGGWVIDADNQVICPKKDFNEPVNAVNEEINDNCNCNCD